MSHSPVSGGGNGSAERSAPRTNSAIVDLRPRSRPPAPRRLPDEHVAHLVLAAAAGEHAAWDALVNEFSGLIWAVVRAHRLRDADGGDVVQLTWLRLVESLDRLHDPARVGAWLATTARRECLRVLGGNQRQLLTGDQFPEQESPDPLPGESLARLERNQAMSRGFSLLRASDQALLRLLMAEPSPSYEEISAALDMPVGSIGPTRQRALARLRQALEDQGTLTLLAD
ncbi:MAG TPA: sigma-70 family RNA polymerase sigma factor [Solirubrobacteraceae bacterium]|nr:sigma-70 family RNA polymerase sigma factor [Solirubrobacteraceae bacterium]